MTLALDKQSVELVQTTEQTVGARAFEVLTAASSGKKRMVNSDAFLADIAGGCFMVADGVSTLPDSGNTARRCVELCASALRETPPRDVDALKRGIQTVNGRLFAEARQRTATPGACTLAMAAFVEDKLMIANVGDSVVWTSNGGSMRQATEAQVTMQPSKRNPDRMTTRLAAAMGAKPGVEPNAQLEMASPQGALLVASDGVSRLRDFATDAWFRHGAPTAALVDRVRALIEAGQTDDMTLVAVRWRPA